MLNDGSTPEIEVTFCEYMQVPEQCCLFVISSCMPRFEIFESIFLNQCEKYLRKYFAHKGLSCGYRCLGISVVGNKSSF